MANLQKLIDLDGLSYFLGQIKAKFVRSVNNIKPDSSGNINIANMTGATYYSSGKSGLAPIPAAGKQDMALCGDATYKVLPIAGGGTGQTTVAGVRNILGLGNTDGALPIANGGTGADNANTALSNLGILGAIVNASVNGKTITFTKKDNTKFSIDTQDTNNGIVAALLKQNGYVKFANGLILQWGYCESTSTVQKHSFVLPFAKECWHCSAIPWKTPSSGYCSVAYTVSKAEFEIYYYQATRTVPNCYIAIGV